MSLEGKIALVTGATSGIGRAIALRLSEAGATVIATGRRDELLESLSVSRIVSADLRDEKSIGQLFDQIGTLDILVNAAGVALQARITDGSVDEWREMLDVNVLGLALCCQRALAKFPESGGQILNISSLSGHRVPPVGGFYAPTKFAVRAVTESLRWELKDAESKTRISCLSPGFVDTPLLDRYFAGKEETLSELKEGMCFLSPEEIADAALYVLTAPKHLEVSDVLMRSVDQKS